MKKLLTFLMLLTASLPLWAYEFEHEGFYYDWLSETEVKLTYGDEPFIEHFNYSGYVTVPATIVYKDVTYNVTTIGKYAFAYCPNLTVLDIPENIQVLENNYLEGNSQDLVIIMRSTNPPAWADPYEGFYKGAWTLKIPMEAYDLYKQQGWMRLKE